MDCREIYQQLVVMLSRILVLSLPSVVLSYDITEAPVSLDDFKEEYNKNLVDENTGANAAVNILKLNNLIRGKSEPADTEPDAQKLWSWYSGVTVSAQKEKATAFLNKVETDNMVHEQMLTTFNTKLRAALVQGTGVGKVVIDAKNYAAIIGDEKPVPSLASGIKSEALAAYNALQALSKANKAKALALAEARLYGSWLARFEQLRDHEDRFKGATGFRHIVQCLKETLQTTASTDDHSGGESGWAVYHRVSAANQKLIRDAIVKQMSVSASIV